MEFVFICLGISAVCMILFIVWYFTYYKNRDKVEEKIQQKKQQKEAEVITEAGCTFEKGILKLFERKPAIAKKVKIVDDKNYTVSYEPEKIHFGAVTVGGVTSGGVYKTGGYHYISGSEKTGLYRLEYAGNLVHKIQLDDNLYELAQKSTIKKYLNSAKQIQVIDSVNFTEDEIRRAYSNLSSSGYMNMGSDLMKKGKQGYPSYEKCTESMNWICGVSD